MGIKLVKYGIFSTTSEGGVKSHAQLTDRELSDQHPMHAITGLEDAFSSVQDDIAAMAETLAKSSASTISVCQEGHGFLVGTVLCHSETTYKEADNSYMSTSISVGMVKEVIDDDNFVIITSGLFQTDLFDSFSNGSLLCVGKSGGVIEEPKEGVCSAIAVKIPVGVLVKVGEPYKITTTKDIDEFITELTGGGI